MNYEGEVVMRIGPVIVLLLALCDLVTCGSAQSTSGFQSVSGQFAREWLSDFKADNPQPVRTAGNGSDLWCWGGAPKGSTIVDGKLVQDPYYLRPLLNLSSNWLDEAYTDPGTGLPVNAYVDPLTGTRYYVYLNPNTGDPIYTYVVPVSGQPYYTYLDNAGKQATSSTPPSGNSNAPSNGWITA